VTNRIDRTQHARGPVGHPVRVPARSRRRPCNELYDKAVLHAGNQLQALLSVVRHQIGRYELHRLRRDLAVREAEAHSAHLRRGELAHLFRVSRLSELSVSIGYEINQPLQSILSNAQAALLLLAKDNPDLDEIREMLRDIVLDDSRAGEVIRELRARLKKIESPRETRELFLSTQMNADTSLLVRITDRGRGIPPDEHERVFDAFFTTKNDGLGLGLSVSRLIISSHGGRLWAAANSYGPGASFCFTVQRY
jgi:C4-dicarboxylate-specific signal transduction histidine kinase